MHSSDNPYAREIERVRRVYDEFDVEGRYETMWSPFDEIEAAYRSQQTLAMARLFREAGFASLRGLRVLDVGCGRGRQLRMFLDMGAAPEDLDGVDVHEASLVVARPLAPQLRFSSCNGSDLPFPDSRFDLVTQFVTFSSIAVEELRRRLSSEMIRVLRPGGYILWWDMPQLAANAGGDAYPLDLDSLFSGLPRRELQVGRHPTIGDCVRVPNPVRRFVRPLLDRFLILNYPPTHVAALMGPKK